jgi:hypothetical protein
MSENGKSPDDKVFGKRGDAQRILDAAKQRLDGQTMSKDKMAKVQERIADGAEKRDVEEAAGFCEEVVKYLNLEWNDRAFTPEQRIFSIALALVNLREHFPEDKGGKEFFDRVCSTAKEYWLKQVSQSG